MAIAVRNITVSFPGVLALDDVSLEFIPGHVHAVLGANGSGKSTLVKVMTGVYQPDQNSGGLVEIDDKTVTCFHNPMEARETGISVVHQEAPLINALSVAENIALFKGYPRKKGGAIDWRALRRYTEELLSFYDLDIAPGTMVHQLSASERGMLSMSIALGYGEDLKKTKILILDEADASIPEAEAEKFLTHVRHVAELGIPVIMVTHRLKEVQSISDDITILNDGRVVFSGKKGEISEDEIVSNMLRQDQTEADAPETEQTQKLAALWEYSGRDRNGVENENALVVQGLVAKNINHLSFTLKKGEILGFVGIPGSGVNELPMILGGALQRKDGTITVGNGSYPARMTPAKAIRMGMMLQPTDRFRQGGLMEASLRDNMLLPNEKFFWHRRAQAKKLMQESIEEFDIRPQIAEMTFGKFSGGNQQKAIIGKWLQLRPNVLIMDDPTYGVDPAARRRIFASMREAAQLGVAIVIFSTEPEQLSNICSRILVLRGGEVVYEMSRENGNLEREEIARWCYA